MLKKDIKLKRKLSKKELEKNTLNNDLLLMNRKGKGSMADYKLDYSKKLKNILKKF
jgi:hypothetical protein